MFILSRTKYAADIAVTREDYGYSWEEELNKETVVAKIISNSKKSFRMEVYVNNRLIHSEADYRLTIKQCKMNLIKILKDRYES